MANTSSMDSILEFLRKNKFTSVEAALRNELNNRPDLSGSLKTLSLEDKDMFTPIHEERTSKSQSQVYNAQHSGEFSKELIVKEISCRTDGKNAENKSTNVASVGSQSRPNDMAKTAERGFSFSKESTESMTVPSWNSNQRIGPTNDFQNEASSSDKFPEVLYECKISKSTVNGKMATKVSEIGVEDKRSLSDKAQSQVRIDQPVEKLWSRRDELVHPLSDICEDFKTVIPYPTAYLLIGNNKGIAIKEKGVDDVSREWYLENLPQSSNSKEYNGQDFPLLVETSKDELCRLRPVRLKSVDKLLPINWEERYDRDGTDVTNGNRGGGNWLSVSQGITEDISDLVSGFATIGDELSESVDYHNEYWDSDEYDDDDDVGYTREPIEDEAWFLAHEVDYPSDSEKVTRHVRASDRQDGDPTNTEDDDDHSFEEDCSFSGDHYFQSRNVEPVNASDKQLGFSIVEVHGEVDDNDAVAQQLIEEDELNLICGEPVWHGLLTQRTEFDMFDDGCVLNEYERAVLNEMHADNDRRGSVRSIGVGVGSDVAEIGGSNEGGFESHRKDKSGDHHDGPNKKYKKDDGDIVAKWRRKSSDSSTARSSEHGNNANAEVSVNSSPSSLLSYNPEREHSRNERDNLVLGISEEVPGESVEDEEAAAVQEQLRQIKAQEEEFETFELKIVHRKNRTGFEEDKNFHVVLNSVIAGRYHVTEYLGSAAFSKAVQAHDLQTGMDVCVKIIKNNKDFFDQSLDEIKLLKYINKYDPADKYHILRLYDYFYYREHLLIVCELLKANLYEFQKFNRESGGEVYFTMPRLQSITIQCLEALQFLHRLGLIHCDLKPENILIKSYSRCEVKVIDLGSSCFETDNLCSYVQSRSYRAPEVILGLPYNQKIDIWSLGCILAELCSGNVLFQNDSLATLLARVVGITGPIDPYLLAKGKDAHKYFTKSHRLYERNQDTNSMEYLRPKKTSLRYRLPMGDQGFIEFVSYLLSVNPDRRPTASEALKHPWLSFPYEPISS